MVDTQLVARGLRDERVLDAMRRVPRHRFVPLTQRWRAYDDHSLAIGYDQTISQPYIVAMMVEALGLKGFEKVLEIGTGSGYEAAVLAALCRRVDTLEIIPELADQAQALLNELGLANVYVHTADGSQGFPEQAPYDAIVVTAGAPKIPPALLDQLTPEGKLVAPLGSRSCQMLTLIQKRGSGLHQEELGECIFVPLRGSYGWPEE
jgi:protein-L-isoaspartate(D-aspartate) O-methyltransferase